MRPSMLVVFGILVAILIAVSVIYSQKMPGVGNQSAPQVHTEPSAQPNTTSKDDASTPNTVPDLTVDENGLSKATVSIQTPKGLIQFKFYTKDAPNTTNRIVELIQKGFYNGLTFHRVVPNFVIQGGDPYGNGTGGSGVTLQPEFNDRRHVEGTVAMARAADPASADSQFYISLGVLPNLDRNYTVFGQVIQGLDVAKSIAVGDKMTSVTVR